MTNRTFTAARILPFLCAFATLIALAEPAAATGADKPEPTGTGAAEAERYRLGAHAEVDVGILAFLKQGTAIAGGATYGPFRAGLSYASFLSNASLGGVPEGFDLRVNYVIGINAAYFIAQNTDRGFYVQPMLRRKRRIAPHRVVLRAAG